MTERRLSRNFVRAEFECRCGCGFDQVDPALVTALQELRDRVGRAVIVTSGCRCRTHNRRVGGARHSQHLLGRAADVRVPGMTPVELLAAARGIEAFRGLGLYSTFVHLDGRAGRRATWRGTKRGE